jgi:uncharacterized protein (DUF2141 family)
MKTHTKTLLTALAASAMIAGSASAATIIDGWTVIDNEDGSAGGYTETGSWGGSGNGFFGFGHRFDSNTASTGSSATWSFTGLANGTYIVAATWFINENRTQAAPYTVQGISVPTVNQELTPSGGPILADGVGGPASFQILTSTAVVSDGTLTVVLNDVDNSSGNTNYVVADAIAVQLVPEPGSLALLGLGGLCVLRRRRG